MGHAAVRQTRCKTLGPSLTAIWRTAAIESAAATAAPDFTAMEECSTRLSYDSSWATATTTTTTAATAAAKTTSCLEEFMEKD